MLKPLGNRVVLRMLEAATKTKSGLYIPDSAQEKPQQGVVVAVGPGQRNEKGEIVPVSVKEGETVLIGKWSGVEIHLKDSKLLIIPETDILGILD